MCVLTQESRSAAHFHHADTHPEPAIKIIEILAWKCCWVARDSRAMICICVCVQPRAFDRRASKKRARWGNFSNCSERIVLSPLRENTARQTPRRKHSENMRRRVIQLEWPFRMQPVYYSPSLIPATEIIILCEWASVLFPFPVRARCANGTRRCDIEILG